MRQMKQVETLPILPNELVSNIILRAGGVPLLKQISLELVKFNNGVITEYNLVTSPIRQDEIEHYILSKPKSITIFHYDKDKIISILYEPNRNDKYQCYRSIECVGNNISTSEGSRTHQYHCIMENHAIKEFVTEYEDINYDVLTIFNIVNNRTANSSLAKQVCLDTFKYYYRTLKSEMLWTYLYSTINIFEEPASVSARIYDINKYLTPYIYERILMCLDTLEKRECYYHGDYIMKKI